jgi:hypothetical protein
LPELQENCRNESSAGRIFKEEFHGIPAKKRQIICGTDAEGSNGCGTRWFTLEILEEQILGKAGKRG